MCSRSFYKQNYSFYDLLARDHESWVAEQVPPVPEGGQFAVAAALQTRQPGEPASWPADERR